MVQRAIVELEATIVELLSPKIYRVRIDSPEFKGELIDVDQGSSFYDGVVFYKNQKVIIDYRRSNPEKSKITYHL